MKEEDVDSRGDEFAAQGDFDVFDHGAGREVEHVSQIDAGFEIDSL